MGRGRRGKGSRRQGTGRRLWRDCADRKVSKGAAGRWPFGGRICTESPRRVNRRGEKRRSPSTLKFGGEPLNTVVHVTVFTEKPGDFLYGVENGGVVASTYVITDFGKAGVGKLAG